MITFESIIIAYRDCMRHKFGNPSALRFDMDREAELYRLYDELRTRTYAIGPSTAEVVLVPRPREVFAAMFRDRIVHHWIYLRLKPILEWVLIPNTYSCMENRGALKMQLDALQVMSQNPDLWICKTDIKGFFTNIDRGILWQKLEALILQYYEGDDKEELLWLVNLTVFNDPTKDCVFTGNKENWKYIKPEKSLFHQKGKGLAIGNLVSQHYSNYYLNDIDHFFFGLMFFYQRYADDITMVDTRENILNAMPLLRCQLKDICLTLHPSKFYLQPVCNGCDVCGRTIKRGRMYIRTPTYNKAENRIETLEFSEAGLSTLNSYLGLLQHGRCVKKRIELASKLPPEWVDKGYFVYGYRKFKRYGKTNCKN